MGGLQIYSFMSAVLMQTLGKSQCPALLTQLRQSYLFHNQHPAGPCHEPTRGPPLLEPAKRGSLCGSLPTSVAAVMWLTRGRRFAACSNPCTCNFLCGVQVTSPLLFLSWVVHMGCWAGLILLPGIMPIELITQDPLFSRPDRPDGRGWRGNALNTPPMGQETKGDCSKC